MIWSLYFRLRRDRAARRACLIGNNCFIICRGKQACSEREVTRKHLFGTEPGRLRG